MRDRAGINARPHVGQGRPIGGRACPRSVEIDGKTLGTIFYDIEPKQPGGSGVFFRTLPIGMLGK